MGNIYATVGVILALLLILGLLVLGVLAWRKRRQPPQPDPQPTEPEPNPAGRPIWRPGDGGGE